MTTEIRVIIPPPGMTRYSKALYVISHLGKAIDRDSVKILKRHILKLNNSKTSEDDFVLTAIDTYLYSVENNDDDSTVNVHDPSSLPASGSGTSPSNKNIRYLLAFQGLLESLEIFIESALQSDSPGIGTPIVIASPRNLHSQSRYGNGEDSTHDRLVRFASENNFALSLQNMGENTTGNSSVSSSPPSNHHSTGGKGGDHGSILTTIHSYQQPSTAASLVSVSTDYTNPSIGELAKQNIRLLTSNTVPISSNGGGKDSITSSLSTISNESSSTTSTVHSDHQTTLKPISLNQLHNPQYHHGPFMGKLASHTLTRVDSDGNIEGIANEVIPQEIRNTLASSFVSAPHSINNTDPPVPLRPSPLLTIAQDNALSERSLSPVSLSRMTEGSLEGSSNDNFSRQSRLTGVYARARALSISAPHPSSDHPVPNNHSANDTTHPSQSILPPSYPSVPNDAVQRNRSTSVTNNLRTFTNTSVISSNAPIYVPATIVYFAPEMRSVAEELRNGEAGELIVLREIEWRRFPDGFPDLMIRDVKSIRYNHTMFLATFHNMAAIFEQLAIIYALPSYGAKRFTVIVPYFSCGTNERVTNFGEVPTALTLAKMVSITPHSCHGPTQFIILDIHALQEQFYFSDNVHIRLKSCIPLLHDRLLRLPDVDKVAIAFPDEGASKRFNKKLSTFGDPIVCVKKRLGDIRKIYVAEGDPKGKHVVLVDDLVQSGSTLLEAAKAIKDAGALKVSCYVTHAVFPNDSWKRFVSPTDNPEDAPVSYFWITNSIPTTAEKLKNIRPFEILSVSSIIEDILGV